MQERGWAGLKNGPLLRLMREAGVEAFVTTDRNLEYQQNVAAAGFAVVVLVAVTNTLKGSSADDAGSHDPGTPLSSSREGLVLRIVAAGRNTLLERACAVSAACGEDDGPVTLSPSPARYADLAYRISQICMARRPAASALAGEPAFLGQDPRGATLAIAVPRGRLPLGPWRYAVRPNSSSASS